MNNEQDENRQKELPLLKRLRNTVFPVKPTDPAPVKVMKHSAFYLFAVMVMLISLAVVGAIMVVL